MKPVCPWRSDLDAARNSPRMPPIVAWNHTSREPPARWAAIGGGTDLGVLGMQTYQDSRGERGHKRSATI